MTLEEHISTTLRKAYDSFGLAKSGESRSRYKSWEYCHKVFLELHNKKYGDLTEDDFDYLALNLAFFLASWGMYRGSSFLLQRDYKTHIPAVKIIMEEKYDILWDFDPNISNVKDANELLFDNKDENDKGLYFRLEDAYCGNIQKETEDTAFLDAEEKGIKKFKTSKKDKPSDTLITKILLATYACIPAFDTFFKKACKSKSISPKISDKPENAFLELCDFAAKYEWELQFKCKDVYHPPMKVLDLYFWRVGLGLSLVDSFNKGSNKGRSGVEDVLVTEKYFKDKNDLSSCKNKQDAIDFPNGIPWK